MKKDKFITGLAITGLYSCFIGASVCALFSVHSIINNFNPILEISMMLTLYILMFLYMFALRGLK